MFTRLLLVLVLVLKEAGEVAGEAGVKKGPVTPQYVWPLGNTSMHHEVMKGHDAHLPDTNQCFALQQGYPGIPYDAIVLTGSPTSYVDFHFSGEVNFRDLSLSFYVFPIGSKPQGTVLNYRCPSGNVIKMAVMDSLFLVSFWDEYGVSVGVTAISDMLTSDSWNHVVVVRRFSTGNIQIYHNGQLLEDLDDDFPNGIRLPVSGVMRLGRGQDEDEDEQGLHGRYTCLQVFAAALSRDDVANVATFCQPTSWIVQPTVHLEERTVSGEKKYCVTDYIPRVVADPVETEVKAAVCDVVGLHCLTRSLAFQEVMRKHNWVDSGKDTSYYYLVARGRIPAPSDSKQHLLGQVAATDRRVCSRLCMRVKGCESFVYNAKHALGVECLLFRSVLEAKQSSPDTRYYALRPENMGAR